MKEIQSAGKVLKLRFLKTIFVIALSTFCFEACQKTGDSANSLECSGNLKSFSTDVKPVMQVSCAFDSDCHGSGSTSGPGSLLSYTEIFNARSIIRSAILSGEMPKDGSLTTADKNAIICWIDNGALNN